MKRRMIDVIEAVIGWMPRWLQVITALVLIALGTGWAWLVCHLGLPQEGGALGFIAIGLGIVWFGWTVLRDDNGYNV